MDPSLSDPHHPPPFNNFNPFSVTNHSLYSVSVAPPNNNQFFQPSPPLPSPSPSFNHPPYSFMICTAISALNEPDGSSKQAISRYIERSYTGIPPAHGALLTHHLKTLKNSGVLVMVKKSYKLAAADLEPPSRSDFTSNNSVNENQPLPDLAPTSTPQTQKRGRGRPPKAKPTWEQNELPVSRPEEQLQPQAQLIKRPRGRPRKDGALPTVKASVSGGVEIPKPRGRAAGRERKPAVVSAPASVFPNFTNGGVRRRGRPKRVDAGASSFAPPLQANVESGVVVAKRGRGRPPKIGGVIRKPMKPRSGYIRTGRPAGRPRKNAASKGASGRQDIGYGELKKKFELFQSKAKEIVNVLKAEVGGIENQVLVQAIHELEELTKETTEESQRMEEVQPDEQHPEGRGQGHAQSEAEDMQEALF
ncbi:hypothetical protein N665_0374s0022 [Sinapis alba]|nr:hypothetical protein N665_0374s0022 [Sinapis alba]